MSACETAKRWQEALSLLSEIEEANLEPSVVSYNAMTSAYEACGYWDRALWLLREMSGMEMEPDQVTYSAVIVSMLRAGLDGKRGDDPQTGRQCLT